MGLRVENRRKVDFNCFVNSQEIGAVWRGRGLPEILLDTQKKTPQPGLTVSEIGRRRRGTDAENFWIVTARYRPSMTLADHLQEPFVLFFGSLIKSGLA